MNLSLAEVADILGVPRLAHDAPVTGYSIDSRTIQAGDLFFAIRGPRFDGHEFVRAALEAGAVAAVVEQGDGLRVPSTVEALGRLGATQRQRWGGRVVAVTGSAGKTTTKEMIAAVLCTRFRVLKSEGNLNNRYGLPLSLLRLNKTHQVAVVELAMSRSGEITELARIAAPETGVITCVAPVHLEFFSGIEEIAAGKQELVFALPHDGVAILNADDPFVSRFGAGFEGYQVSFGVEQTADFHATRIAEDGPGSVRFRLEWEGEGLEVAVPLPGRHNVLNALAAIATGHIFGVSPRQAGDRLAAFRPLKMRGEILEANGVTVLNDCYNSNPRALSFMLEALARTPAPGRRIAVLGEMLELGPTSPSLHRQAGKQAASVVDYLVAVRGDARCFLEGAIEEGLDPSCTAFFETAAEAGAYVPSLVQPGDVVLFKGSRGVKLEEALERVTGPARQS